VMIRDIVHRCLESLPLGSTELCETSDAHVGSQMGRGPAQTRFENASSVSSVHQVGVTRFTQLWSWRTGR
jgi:hypothetical protein